MLDFEAAHSAKTGKSAISSVESRNIRNHIGKIFILFRFFVKCPQPGVLSGCGWVGLRNADGQDDLAVCLLPVAAGADACGADEIELVIDGV